MIFLLLKNPISMNYISNIVVAQSESIEKRRNRIRKGQRITFIKFIGKCLQVIEFKMGKLSVSVISTSPISFAAEVTHISDTPGAQWPTELQKPFEIKPSQSLMASREFFTYRRNTSYESLESMMNKKHESMAGMAIAASPSWKDSSLEGFTSICCP